MAFNQLLWSLNSKVMNDLLEENPSLSARDVAPYNLFPPSTIVYIEKIESIIREYKHLKEYVDLSTGHCNPTIFKGKASGLYLEAFCNGVSTVLQNMNGTFLSIEESFLSESSISMIEIIDRFENILNILPSLNFALKQIKDGKYSGCNILDLCEDLIVSGSVVENVFRSIQYHCLKQFYKQTKLWVMKAVLNDPYDEFFITSIGEVTTSMDSSLSNFSLVGTILSTMTSSPGMPKFQVNPTNLPKIIPFSVAMKIVFIGEALTICQHSDCKSKSNDRILSMCGISEESIASQFSEIEKNEQFNLRAFTSLIDDLWIGVNKYIRQVSDEVGNVCDELSLMRDIFLLGRGELFQEFLLKGGSILNSDVTLVDSRNLNLVFKDAIYYVYLTENSDLTDQFFFTLPHKTALRQGSTTWSNMLLRCKIKWPLHYLFTSDVILSYNRLFRFLLRLKKAQIDATSWKTIMSIKNHSLRMDLIEVRMHLLSIVGNLQNYCFTNVIANEMTILLSSIKNTTMFTDLQKALSLFLANICNRLFLPEINTSFLSTTCEGLTSIETVHKCFRSIFALCGLFSDLSGKNDDYVMKKLTAIKSQLQRILKNLFSLLQKIDQTYYCDSGNSDAHLHSLMMCLDYNGFFRNKFHLDPSD